MTKQERAARAKLKRDLKDLLRENNRMAMQKLESLMNSGSGIVDEQMKDLSSVGPAKDFLVAFGIEMQWQWGKPYANDDRGWKRKINNYARLM